MYFDRKIFIFLLFNLPLSFYNIKEEYFTILSFYYVLSIEIGNSLKIINLKIDHNFHDHEP